jgi:hypothetical protein
VLRQTSGSKRKKFPKLGSPATQERHEHEEHRGGAHRGLEAKGRLSLAVSGQWARDALGRAKEEDSDDETWGKGSARSHR